MLSFFVESTTDLICGRKKNQVFDFKRLGKKKQFFPFFSVGYKYNTALD
jgi:hypothetical protein